MALSRAQIQTAYQNSLGRPASQSDEDSFFAVSQSGALTDAQVYSTISNSREADLNADPVVRFYQAAFGRVPDQAGLDNATDYVRSFGATAQTYQNLANMFAASPEFTNRFGTGTTVDAAYVQALYSTILGRTASSAEVNGFTSGQNGFTTRGAVLYAISQSNEAISLSDTAVNGFLNNAAQGSAVYSGTLYTAANGGTGTGPGGSGSTFTLTASTTTPDNLTGTAGNDTFNASLPGSLATGDSVNGAGGTDTINARYSVSAASTTVAAPTLNSVENIFIRADLNTDSSGAAETTTFDLSDVAGEAQVWADNVNSFTTGGDTATLAFNNIDLGTTLGLRGAGANNAANVTFGFRAGQVTGAADRAALQLDAATYNNVTIAGIETLDITSGGATKNTLGALTTAQATTLNISGAQSLTITGALGNTVTTVDASQSTGGVSYQLGTVTGTVSAKGGSGNDTISLGTLVATANTSIDGGAGTADVLKVDAGTADLAAQLVNLTNNNVKGIETLNFGGNVDGVDLNNVKFTVSDFVFSNTANAQAIAITNHSSANTYTLTGGAATDETSFTITTLKEADTLANVLNLKLINSDVGAIDGGTASNTIETINITSSKAADGSLEGGANTLGTVTVNAGGVINLTGNADTTLTLGTNSSLDASTSAFTGKVTVVGSANADIIKGGALADTITGGRGVDTLTGGGGIDTFRIASTAVRGDGVDRDIITDFQAGTGGDVFNLNAATGTTLTGTNEFTSAAALQTVAGTGNIQIAAATEVVVITGATIANVTDANSLNGTNLLTAVGGTITGAAGAGANANVNLFAIGIQGGGVAIYEGNAGSGNATFENTEITLVGVLQNTSVSALTFNNFANAAA